MSTNFDEWQKDYRQAALNSGAFEYEGIRSGQEKKEFWFNIIAAGIIIGLSIVCPPAGLAAGAVYTAIDLAGAAKKQSEDLQNLSMTPYAASKFEL